MNLFLGRERDRGSLQNGPLEQRAVVAFPSKCLVSQLARFPDHPVGEDRGGIGDIKSDGVVSLPRGGQAGVKPISMPLGHGPVFTVGGAPHPQAEASQRSISV